MRKDLIIGLLAAVAASAAGVLFGMRYQDADATPPKFAVALLESTRFNDADGKPQALNQWAGKTLVINFWATWCTPCLEEIPELSQLQAQYEAKAVQFVGIAVDSAANVAHFLEDHKVGFPLLVGESDAIGLSQQFGNSMLALPYTVVLDANGAVRLTKLGRISKREFGAALERIAAKG